MAAEAQKQDEQHTLVLTAIVDVQDTLTAIREAPPSAVTPASWGSLNELAAMFNRSMDTMEALTRAVADSTASMTTMHARLTAVEARLKIPPVQEVITPAATRSTREEGVLVAQYISHSQCPTACLRSSISQYPTTYLHSGSNPCYGRRTSKLCPFPHHCGACRSRGSAQHPLGPDLLPTGHYICCLWYPGSRTVFLRFRNNAAATAFVDPISNGLSGLYADSSASIIHSFPPGISNLGN